MTARRVLLSSVVVSLLAAPAAAETGAQGSKVLVFPMSGTVPNDPGDGLAQLTRLLARSAGLIGEVKISQASFTDAAALAGCETQDAACYDKVAETLHVNQLVLGAVEPGADGTTLSVKVEQFEKATGLLQQHDDVIPAASFDEMKTAFLRSSTRAFVGGDAKPPPEPPVEPPPVEPPPAPIPTPVPAAQEAERSFDLHRVGMVPWIVAGSGVALAGVGTVFLIMAQSRQDDVNSAPTNTTADLDRLVELEDEGERYTMIGNVLLIGGAAVAIGGGAWAVYKATRMPHREAGAPSVAPPAVSIAPLPLRGGGGLTLSVPLP